MTSAGQMSSLSSCCRVRHFLFIVNRHQGSGSSQSLRRVASHDTVVERVVNWNEPDCQQDYADSARELAFMRLVRAIEPQVTPRCLSVSRSVGLLARIAANDSSEKKRPPPSLVPFPFHSTKQSETNAFWDVPS